MTAEEMAAQAAALQASQQQRMNSPQGMIGQANTNLAMQNQQPQAPDPQQMLLRAQQLMKQGLISPEQYQRMIAGM
jgi:hypothetical protein